MLMFFDKGQICSCGKTLTVLIQTKSYAQTFEFSITLREWHEAKNVNFQQKAAN